MKKPKTTPFSLALRKARPLIENEYEQFICLALKRVAPKNLGFRVRICLQMDGCYVYDNWIKLEHPKVYRKMQRIGYAAFKAGRLAWIDDMIRREET